MEGDAPDEMVAELEMWTEMATVPWLGAMDEIVERFNGANPGIQVTHSGFSGLAYGKATKTAFAGGAVPDCLQTDAGPGVRSAFIEADQLGPDRVRRSKQGRHLSRRARLGLLSGQILGCALGNDGRQSHVLQ